MLYVQFEISKCLTLISSVSCRIPAHEKLAMHLQTAIAFFHDEIFSVPAAGGRQRSYKMPKMPYSPDCYTLSALRDLFPM